MSMKTTIIAVLIALLSAAAIADYQLPDRQMTPGATRTTNVAYVCKPGTAAKDRYVTQKVRSTVFAAYGVPANYQGICAGTEGCEVDHLISLELGGSNALSNLWPQPYAGEWNAHQKDKLEHKLHKLVCSGQITLEDAQREISINWIDAYKKYVGPR